MDRYPQWPSASGTAGYIRVGDDGVWRSPYRISTLGGGYMPLWPDNGKIVFSITDYYIESCGRMYIKGWCQSAGTNWHDIGTLDKLRRAEDCLGGGVRL